MNKLREWLRSIDYECYFDNFYSNGFEDIDYLASLTVKDLSDIGIRSSQHVQEVRINLSWFWHYELKKKSEVSDKVKAFCLKIFGNSLKRL